MAAGIRAHTMIEKRHFTRIGFDASARLICNDQDWATHLLDISLKGALVEQPPASDLSLNTSVELNLLLSDEETEIMIRGHIAHQEAKHIGIEFDHMDVDSASHLRRLIELNTGSETLLERELEALIHRHSHPAS